MDPSYGPAWSSSALGKWPLVGWRGREKGKQAENLSVTAPDPSGQVTFTESKRWPRSCSRQLWLSLRWGGSRGGKLTLPRGILFRHLPLASFCPLWTIPTRARRDERGWLGFTFLCVKLESGARNSFPLSLEPSYHDGCTPLTQDSPTVARPTMNE